MVKVGDFVDYKAGIWTEADISKLGDLYSGMELPTSANPFKFGGFGIGSSKDLSVKSFESYDNTYLGWRVLNINEDGTLDIVHAGAPEGYYHPFSTNSAYKSEYILKGTKNNNDTTSITNGVTIRDWSMYINNTYAKSAHCITYEEALNITGVTTLTDGVRKTGSYYWLGKASSAWYDVWNVTNDGSMYYGGNKKCYRYTSSSYTKRRNKNFWTERRNCRNRWNHYCYGLALS